MLFSVRAFLSLIAALGFVIASCAQPLNDNFADRLPIEPFVPFNISVTGATFEPLDPLPAYKFPMSGEFGSVWCKWTPESTGFAAIVDTENKSPASVMEGLDSVAVFQGDDLAMLHDVVWVYFSPIYGKEIGGPKPFIGFNATGGSPVAVGMVGEASKTVSHNLLMTFSETPIIVEPPASQTNYAGGAVSFHFSSPSYRFGRTQWQFNSQDIPHATNAVLFVSDLRPSKAGEYRVVIEATNSVGVLKRTLSPAATLTVVSDIIPPTISFERATNSASDFVINIFGMPNQWYSIDRSSDFNSWVPAAKYLANTVKSGPTSITLLANAEYFRVEHLGNLPEV